MEERFAALSDDDLLAQCDVQTFRAGGPGGQHQNMTDSGVRLRHLPTGLTVTCRRERSQLQNKQDCLHRLRLKLAALERTPEPRVPTQPTREAQRRRLEEKARRAALKRQRAAPPADD
jgi:protein subunit release factor B